jgi:hypothetical protein
MTPKPRVIGPVDEDRRTDKAQKDDAKRRARESGVESLPDGEADAERESTKARDD